MIVFVIVMSVHGFPALVIVFVVVMLGRPMFGSCRDAARHPRFGARDRVRDHNVRTQPLGARDRVVMSVVRPRSGVRVVMLVARPLSHSCPQVVYRSGRFMREM